MGDSGNRGKTKRKAPVHAWKAGESGNPKGRPKVPEEIREELRTIFAGASPKAARTLVKMLTDDDGHLRHKAAESILKRVLGDELLLTLGGQVEVTGGLDAHEELLRKLVEIATSRTEGSSGSDVPAKVPEQG